MISYALAKELKEAGFPQNPNSHDEFPNSWIDSEGHTSSYRHTLDGELMYVPTISELIEVCADRFKSLIKNPEIVVGGQPKPKWEALSPSFKIGDSDASYFGFGDTAEEAVARLWLALDKK